MADDIEAKVRDARGLGFVPPKDEPKAKAVPLKTDEDNVIDI